VPFNPRAKFLYHQHIKDLGAGIVIQIQIGTNYLLVHEFLQLWWVCLAHLEKVPALRMKNVSERINTTIENVVVPQGAFIYVGCTQNVKGLYQILEICAKNVFALDLYGLLKS
jgi:hypothetical protein